MTETADPLAGYTKLLQLTNIEIPESVAPDDRSGSCYLPDPELELATEIALITGRPLLLFGAPGSGKSSWAPYVARNLNWGYHEINIHSDTEASDLFYQFDAVERLRDAQRRDDNIHESRYITPQPLWFAFSFFSAIDFMRENEIEVNDLAVMQFNEGRDVSRSVLLLDEIDKADPNLPNSLLDVIAGQRFRVPQLKQEYEFKLPPDPTQGVSIDKKPIDSIDDWIQAINQLGSLLLVITSNAERDLPPAFTRRCVVHHISPPNKGRFIEIAKERRDQDWKGLSDEEKKEINDALEVFATHAIEARKTAAKEQKPGPSVAEFLDLVNAWERTKFDLNKECLKTVMKTIYNK